MRLKSVGRIGGMVLLLLAAGCSAVVDGTMRPAPTLKPRPVTGRTVERVLLGEHELSKLFNQSFESDPDLPPRIGGSDAVLDDRSGASPYQCALAVGPLEQSSYQSTDVQDGARETWWDTQTERDASVISVDEGVVALPTAAAADTVFGKLSAHWKQCDGVKVNYREDTHTLTGVDEADSVLSAAALSSSSTAAIPEARVVGVRVNCLIEVEVAYFSSSGIGPDERKSSAVNIAHRMMDKVSELS